ncbi:alginate lyase family protein [Pontibacter ramchanderi]|uniref:Heparinase II/III-like protein n=1 Tax=Pontibacter ramchanderi TaxID=1179743 RepID=A0A2N3U7Q9_9BACT|nr:alginate lyase family protein [Pontibacter ramchanderi]PKV62790.1 heparinase II/III-like protein [Pontibacter ramchanderi]
MKKLSLYYNTIRYLKIKQLVYQVTYRLRKAKPLYAYIQEKDPAHLKQLNFSDYLSSFTYATPDGSFNFINQEVHFGENIDWSYSENGKLWNYNLQYANYLLQEEIPLAIRLQWIRSLYESLNKSEISLEPYPASIRIMNLIRLICRHKLNEEDLLVSLRAELNFLSGRVEYHLLANHVLENSFALLMGGAFFEEPNWLTTGQSILLDEMDEQILEDGAHYELSPMYHQIILHRLLELVDWYQSYDGQNEAFLEILKSKASKMLSWLAKITFKNNQIPCLNDSAPNITYDTESLRNYALFLNIESDTPRPLSSSGYRKYEFGDYECLVDMANIGPSYQAGHGHADALSFILHYKQVPLFVEAGTSTYQAGPIRSYERSTFAHNTVVIDNADQSDVWGSFRLGDRAITSINSETKNSIEGEHDGYEKRYAIKHNRKFSFDRSTITIQDRLVGKKASEAIALIHLHPAVTFKVESSRIHLDTIGTISFKNALRIETAPYQFASAFNTYQKATVFKIHFKNVLDTVIEFE